MTTKEGLLDIHKQVVYLAYMNCPDANPQELYEKYEALMDKFEEEIKLYMTDMTGDELQQVRTQLKDREENSNED